MYIVNDMRCRRLKQYFFSPRNTLKCSDLVYRVSRFFDKSLVDLIHDSFSSSFVCGRCIYTSTAARICQANKNNDKNLPYKRRRTCTIKARCNNFIFPFPRLSKKILQWKFNISTSSCSTKLSVVMLLYNFSECPVYMLVSFVKGFYCSASFQIVIIKPSHIHPGNE